MSKRDHNTAASDDRSAPELPEAELEVMACLWNGGAQTAAEIRESLASYRPMAHGSVLTLLKRLGDKGLVLREKAGQGKAFAYRACRDPEPTYGGILRKLTQRVFGGSSVALVASLLEAQEATPEELRELKRLLSKIQKQNKSGDPS